MVVMVVVVVAAVVLVLVVCFAAVAGGTETSMSRLQRGYHGSPVVMLCFRWVVLLLNVLRCQWTY